MKECCRSCGREDMAIFKFQDRDSLGRPRCPKCRVAFREALEAKRKTTYNRNASRKFRANHAAKLAAGKGGF